MPFKPGQSGNPTGRKAKADKFARPIAAAEKRIADRLPGIVDNLLLLADGGYEQVTEEWQPAGLVIIGSGEYALPAFPDTPATELVLVSRKSSIAAPDRAANIYLADRILGKPSQRQEITGPNGEALAAPIVYIPQRDGDD